eukprot:5107579-Pyramimonas_sp.AAC.1
MAEKEASDTSRSLRKKTSGKGRGRVPLPEGEKGLWKRKGTLVRPPVAKRVGGIHAFSVRF